MGLDENAGCEQIALTLRVDAITTLTYTVVFEIARNAMIDLLLFHVS